MISLRNQVSLTSKVACIDIDLDILLARKFYDLLYAPFFRQLRESDIQLKEELIQNDLDPRSTQ